MAQKDLEPGDVPFEIPKFDEDEFVRKELISFRTTIILFAFSLAVALVTFGVWKYYWAAKDLTGPEWWLLVVIALAFAGVLPFLYRAFRVDISHWKRREWLGTTTMHFFFWLGFTLLLANPPISDNAAPRIEAFATPAVQSVGQDVTFAAYVGDNEAVDAASLRFCVTDLASPPPTFGELSPADQTACRLEWTKDPKAQVWTYSWRPAKAGNYTFYVHAVDTKGLAADFRGRLNVTNPILFVSPSQGTRFNEDLQELKVQIAPGFNDLLAVRYVIDGGMPHNMTPPSGQDVYWKSDPRSPGWKRGANNLTFQVVEQTIYLHQFEQTGGTAGSETRRAYSVDANYPNFNSVKEYAAKQKPAPGAVSTPGFDGTLVVAALGATTLLVYARARRHA